MLLRQVVGSVVIYDDVGKERLPVLVELGRVRLVERVELVVVFLL